jgi:hypothetical protein
MVVVGLLVCVGFMELFRGTAMPFRALVRHARNGTITL